MVWLKFTNALFLIVRFDEWEGMAAPATAEVCDTNAGHITSGGLRVLQASFEIYGTDSDGE
ncbi:hypothetical protein SDJN02_23239, partial [Cucurbita argyrosperma subsp. argyrosperma]